MRVPIRPPAAVVLACCVALGGRALAAGQASSNFAGFDSIQTDTIDWNANTGAFTLPKRFTATRSGSSVAADRATGNSKSKIVHATGNVVVHQRPSGDSNSKLGNDPSTLTCDKLDADASSKLYTATGHVHFVQADRDATADSGTLDDATNTLHLRGNVHIKDGEQYLDAADVLYNTSSGDLKANGDVMVRTPAQAPAPNVPAATASPKPKHR